MRLFISIFFLLIAGFDQELYATQKATEKENCAFTIQEASLESDLEQIIEVVNRAYQRRPFCRAGRDRVYLFQLKEILLNPNKKLFVLCCANRICGTILVSQSEISLFSIHPDFQGQRYGSWLLLAAEKEVSKNYDTAYLRVIPLFQEKLITYYESMGYHSYNERELLSKEKLDEIQECYHDQVYALILRKKLGYSIAK